MHGNFVLDMYHGETFDAKRHTVPAVFWSDGQLRYWGWIYDGAEIVGDFTADSVSAIEAALGLKFIHN